MFKNLVVHPQQVMHAHLAACAAGMQKKFIPFVDAYWEQGFAQAMQTRDQSKLGQATIDKIVADLKLDAAKFKADAEGDACKERIAKDQAEMEKFHVGATPAFFINGRMIVGGMPKEEFKRIIDEKLKIAEASGVPAKDYYEQEIMGKGEKVFRAAKDPKPAK